MLSRVNLPIEWFEQLLKTVYQNGGNDFSDAMLIRYDKLIVGQVISDDGIPVCISKGLWITSSSRHQNLGLFRGRTKLRH